MSLTLVRRTKIRTKVWKQLGLIAAQIIKWETDTYEVDQVIIELGHAEEHCYGFRGLPEDIADWAEDVARRMRVLQGALAARELAAKEEDIGE